MVQSRRCPECGEPAEVGQHSILESTDGPVEHARITCAKGHWFFLPVSMLEAWSQPALPGPRTHLDARA